MIISSKLLEIINAFVVTTIDHIIKEKQLLVAKYAVLAEDAYNHMVSDTPLSDIFEFEATQVMQQIEALDSELNACLV